MSEHVATIDWCRGDQPFADNRYSRAHDWTFDGGAVVRGSSAPSSVAVPMSDPAAVDPEEAFVAALSSCHMLFFLAFAAKAGFVVDRYRDAAIGVLGRDDRGKTSMTVVTLRPEVVFSGAGPDAAALADLHHRAHEACYIANSVRAEVRVEPV
ncbi:OsmC family protein [Brevundimonas subvibrioides]|uniref:OsmC family protein n=1 Tax=Brevundimonas subvibrioides (strain ATCC 15264 / DSM 4735 / LMG 14903 / NBRC 16000 / CB 81) TaxID=633149 RepID=D9QJ78_BRESC|nr:OsmC family protein [Brevundimonas subvibrioides]ADK99602.1 OsmC family protein [Brevundimonas subvibrioides ATCC 15264]